MKVMCSQCSRLIDQVEATRGRCPDCATTRARVRNRIKSRRSYQRHGVRYSRAYRKARVLVLERDNYRCRYCGRPATTADHVIPRSKGGSDDPSNLVAACLRCNTRKGGRVDFSSGSLSTASPRMSRAPRPRQGG